MAVSSLLESSFLTSSLASSAFKPKRKSFSAHVLKHHAVSCRHGSDEEIKNSPAGKNLGKLALAAVAAGVLTMGSFAADPAFAAKTGGRVGGQAFRSAAPRSSGPRINNSRTNVFINPPIAPPLVGGYGYGYGGYGWSPFSFFAPGPSVAVGVGGGLDLIVLFIFLGTVSAVVRRFFGGSRGDEDDEDY